jgi:hypothetical protein
VRRRAGGAAEPTTTDALPSAPAPTGADAAERDL